MEETLCISPYHLWKSSPRTPHVISRVGNTTYVNWFHGSYRHTHFLSDILFTSKLVLCSTLCSEEPMSRKKLVHSKIHKRLSLQDQQELVCRSLHRVLRKLGLLSFFFTVVTHSFVSVSIKDPLLSKEKLLKERVFLLVEFLWLLQHRLRLCCIPSQQCKYKTHHWNSSVEQKGVPPFTNDPMEANDDGSSSNSNSHQQPQSDEEENEKPVAGDSTNSHQYSNGNNNNSSNNNNNNNNTPNRNEHDPMLDSPPKQEKMAVIRVVDGTKKIKYGTTYWVQRNVITIQVLTSFTFHTCHVTCCKDTSHETPKSMDTIGFYSFQLCPKQVFLAGNKLSYEYTFKKKLPFTSGRPETQKGIWLKADFFSSNNELLATAETDKFFVCSRPNRTVGLTVPDGTSSVSSNGSGTSNISSNSSLSLTPTPSSTSMSSNGSSNSSLNDSTPSPPSNSQNSNAPNIDFNNKANYTTSPQLRDQSTNGAPSTESLPSSSSSNQQQTQSNQTSLVGYIDDKDDYHLYINSIHPSAGSINGGQYITLEGRFKVPQSMQNSILTIYFGLLPSPQIIYTDDSRIVCISPARIISGNVRVTGVVGGKTFQNFVLFSYFDEDQNTNDNR